MTLVQRQVAKGVSGHDKSPPNGSYYVLLGAYIVLLLALSIDLIVMVETPFLAEGTPIFDNLFLLRTALIAASSLLTVVAVVKLRRRKPGTGQLNNSRDFPASRTGRIAFLNSLSGSGLSARRWVRWMV